MIQQAITLAQQFGDCLTQGDYDTACTLLCPELQQQYSAETMIDYGSGPIKKSSCYGGLSLN